ncbi:MFS transporter [Sulfitobacter sp. HNIBRBA3233]|uniref:MFS transporter n=1 Tax=Sulfitobacter marinivivus TaxID=3158558 RepID=UPI0032DEAF12
MGRSEFVALVAMMTATIAFSIDAMLPALPQIAADLSPGAPENAALILSSFLLGIGLGTFVAGPLADAFGRKPVILAGAAVYIVCAAIAWRSQSLELVLLARAVQGFGAAAPRVVSIAVVRDRYAGRQMAQITSVVMMIFVLVPAVAPLLGSFIIDAAGWRGIFIAFIVFACVFSSWMMIRLPETLPVSQRRPIRLALMLDAVREMFANRGVRLSILVQTLTMSFLFLTLMLVQPIYDLEYGRASEFPFWFFIVALIAGSASLLNALLVVRFGMVRLVTIALGAQVLISASFFALDLGNGPQGFYFFVFWQTCAFFQAGLTLGNLNALAMEPMGHIAGMAASVIGAVSTVGASMISALIALLIGPVESGLFLAGLGLAIGGFSVTLMMGRAMRQPAI